MIFSFFRIAPPDKNGCAPKWSETTKDPEIIYTDSNGVVLMLNEFKEATVAKYR